MSSLTIRKTVSMLAGGVFLGCVGSCGAQSYKVSLDQDHRKSSVPASASDPSSPAFGIHATSGWKNLPVRFKLGVGMTEDKKDGLLRAMATWQKAIGRQLFQLEANDTRTGDDFKDLYSSLKDSVNGFYFDNNWAKTGKPEVVLATTIWDNGNDPTAIQTADIRFNSQYYIIGDAFLHHADETREVVDMESLALHELGHFLGLAHVPADQDPQSIMNPSLFIGEGMTNRKLGRNDVIRIQRIYHCTGTSCDIDTVMKELEGTGEDALTTAGAARVTTGE